VTYSSSNSADLLSGNVLQITVAGQQYDLQLDPSQSFAGDHFHVSAVNPANPAAGSLVTFV
jgi:hypothetical protein